MDGTRQEWDTLFELLDSVSFDSGSGGVLALRPAIEYLGLDWTQEQHRIEKDATLGRIILPMILTKIPHAEGRKCELVLPVEYVPYWMLGIDTEAMPVRKVARMVDAYKAHCIQLLLQTLRAA